MSFGLPEQVVLLGLDDATGKCISSYANYSWTAAVLAELVVRDRIDVGGSRVVVIDGTQPGDDVLDEALAALQDRNLRLPTALRSVLVTQGRERTLRRLVDAGILEYHDNRVLGIFHVRRYPAHDGKVENDIRERLRRVVLADEEPDRRTRALLGIACGSGLMRTFLSQEERQMTRTRIDALTGGDPLCQELRRVIEEDEAAATTAAIIAATS